MVTLAHPEQFFRSEKSTTPQSNFPVTGNFQEYTTPQIIYAYNQEDIQRWILFGATIAVICILIGAALMYYAKR